MFKNTLKRLGAIVLALAMAMSVMMVSAFAEDAVTGVTITKEVSKSDNAYVTPETFTFTVTPGTAKAATSTTPAIYAGLAGGVLGTTITFDSTKDSSKTGTLQVVNSVFANAAPGIYRYEVKETAGSTNGMTYSTATKYLDVYVTTGGVVYAKQIENEAGTAKEDGTFTNTQATKKLTVKKVIEGNQADPNKEFTFTITISGVTGEQYTLTKGQDTQVVKTDVPVTIKLKGGESLTIEGLSPADTYIVDEADYSADGYTTTGEVTTATAIGDTDKEVTVTNTKSVNTPTGVIMNIAPYVLMVALAGGIAFFFLRRRNAE